MGLHGRKGQALACLRYLSTSLKITSRAANSTAAHRKVFSRGALTVAESSCGDELLGPTGTMVEVFGLFSGMQVRQRLAQRSHEKLLVKEFVQKMCILHHHISWDLKDEATGQSLVHVVGQKSVSKRIIALHGLQMLVRLQPFSYQESKGWSLEGLLSLPHADQCHWNTDLQYSYLNHRWLRGRDLLTVVLNKIYTQLMAPDSFGPRPKHSQQVPKYPVFVLKLCLPDHEFDIFSEPDKTVALYSHEEKVREFIVRAVQAFLLQHGVQLFPSTALAREDRAIPDDVIVEDENDENEAVQEFATSFPFEVGFAIQTELAPAASLEDLYRSGFGVSGAEAAGTGLPFDLSLTPVKAVTVRRDSYGESFAFGSPLTTSEYVVEPEEEEVEPEERGGEEELENDPPAVISTATSMSSIIPADLFDQFAFALPDEPLPSQPLPSKRSFEYASREDAHLVSIPSEMAASAKQPRLQEAPECSQDVTSLRPYLEWDTALTLDKQQVRELRLLGQMDGKFIVAMEDQRHVVVLLDQHAIDERTRFEEILSQGCAASIVSVEVHPREELVVNDYDRYVLYTWKDHIEQWGFRYSIDSSHLPSKLILTHVPSFLEERLTTGDLFEFCSWIRTNSHLPTSMLKPPAVQRIAATKACRSAVKFNTLLSKEACHELLQSLQRTDLPFQCAHGRPSMVPVVDLSHLLSHSQQQSSLYSDDNVRRIVMADWGGQSRVCQT